MQNDYTWIAELKAGDKVFVEGYEKTLETVEKVTPTGLVKVNGDLYTKFGTARGNGFNRRSRIKQATSEAITKFTMDAFIAEVARKADLRKATYKQAVEINAMLELGVERMEGF